MARERKTKAPTVKGDYPVGYCRTPVNTRWKKGHCPNPLGRGAGRKPPETDLARLFGEELRKEVKIQEDGKSKKVSKAAVMVTQLVNQGIKGDRKAVELAFKLMASADTSTYLDASDLSPAMIANFLSRHGGGEASDD
jgi:hypothetical protein